MNRCDKVPYVLVPVDGRDASCTTCGRPALMLIAETDIPAPGRGAVAKLPAFYVCHDCRTVAQVGVRPVPTRGAA